MAKTKVKKKKQKGKPEPVARVHDLRVTSLWIESLPDSLDGTSKPPYAWQADDKAYAEAFEKAQQGAGDDELAPPWKTPAGQLFWARYLGKEAYGEIKGKEARRLLVPLRRKLPCRVEAAWLDGYADLEAYYYPHALGLVFSAVSRSELTLQQAKALAYKITQDGPYTLACDPPLAGAQDLTVSALAAKAREAFRRDAPPGALSRPFTIVTVVRGEGVDSTQPTPEQSEVHRFLHAVTSWPPPEKPVSLQALAKARLASSQQGDSDVLYAGERGRAVWMPWTFGPHEEEIHSLGCYHRNLVLATLETESLLALTKASAAKLATDGQLTGSRYDTSRQAVLALGRLYGGSKDATWSSWSVRRQIDDSGQVEAINTLRDYYDPSFGPLRGRET